MAWQDKGEKAGSPIKAYFRPIGRMVGDFPCEGAKGPHLSLAGLTGGLAAVFHDGSTLFCPAPCPNKQTAENQSRLMIAENLAMAGL